MMAVKGRCRVTVGNWWGVTMRAQAVVTVVAKSFDGLATVTGIKNVGRTVVETAEEFLPVSGLRLRLDRRHGGDRVVGFRFIGERKVVEVGEVLGGWAPLR